MKLKYRMTEHNYNHCPGGCYLFKSDSWQPPGTYHIPVDIFWGRVPWNWKATP